MERWSGVSLAAGGGTGGTEAAMAAAASLAAFFSSSAEASLLGVVGFSFLCFLSFLSDLGVSCASASLFLSFFCFLLGLGVAASSPPPPSLPSTSSSTGAALLPLPFLGSSSLAWPNTRWLTMTLFAPVPGAFSSFLAFLRFFALLFLDVLFFFLPVWVSGFRASAETDHPGTANIFEKPVPR
ncbi:uncharacterized protein LY79DRAFT_549564 [Colletotrichum navitas]|uniref:Uncharacterized protein n=1 Tax=Colletotrichum navitas TaxID=681940 RepID=A0AAD8Q3X5_9PEZI|nr:uncharacterized protein LY79DRAFT_549564 [Colletotrichum navitas]KAK1594374.1 hypothetical protein LY79DRAFT_549564 [Colletotrichum navitas]